METKNFISKLESILIKNNVGGELNIPDLILAKFIYTALENLITLQKRRFIETDVNNDLNFTKNQKKFFTENDSTAILYIDLYNLLIDCNISVVDCNSTNVADYLFKIIESLESI